MSTISAPSANYGHYATSIGNWRNTPVVVGGYYDYDIHVEHFPTSKWEIQADFPFVKLNMYRYSMATINDLLYMFGKIICLVKGVGLN